MVERKMVVGLGNPGDEYIDTRHNLGFEVVDGLADRLCAGVRTFRDRRFGAMVAECPLGNRQVLLVKPQQFMNRSGTAVAAAAKWYGLGVADVMVVGDDMDLECGCIRLRADGLAGGHRGLADVLEKLGTNRIARCRVGIGHSGEAEAYDYVLTSVPRRDRSAIQVAIGRAVDAVLCWIEHGIDRAMNEFNRRQE